MVSKQEVNVTIGARVPLIMILAELAGLPVTQFRFDVIIHRTLSPLSDYRYRLDSFRYYSVDFPLIGWFDPPLTGVAV